MLLKTEKGSEEKTAKFKLEAEQAKAILKNQKKGKKAKLLKTRPGDLVMPDPIR